jgi:hypothetical protein
MVIAAPELKIGAKLYENADTIGEQHRHGRPD